MYDLPNVRNRRLKPIYIALTVLAACAGAYVGYITVDRYAAIARACVGIAVFYLIYVDFFVPAKRSVAFDKSLQYLLPQDMKYATIAFLWTLIMFWAGVQVVQVIWWLLAAFGIGT